jgi:type IV secretory pathway TraG/TraD family ATPase VirD4
MTGPRGKRWLRNAAIIDAAVTVLGVLLGNPALFLLGLLVLAGLVAVFYSRIGSSFGVRFRAQRDRWHDGTASRTDLHRVASAGAVRKQARVLRPGLDRDAPAGEIAVSLCTVGPQTIYQTCQLHTTLIGVPRSGKSGRLMGMMLDTVQAVVATTTKPDLYHYTHRIRGRRGPVYVFNPTRLTGLASTLVFDPLQGCEETDIAHQRASDLIEGSQSHGTDDRDYWLSQAKRMLMIMLHAAALGGLSMLDVQRWITDPLEYGDEIQQLLHDSPLRAVAHNSLQLIKTNSRTLTSITSTGQLALNWLSSPAAFLAAGQHLQPPVNISEEGVTVGPRDSFDVAKFIRERGTIYLIGDDDELVAPLITAFAGYFARTAKILATSSPGGRLDPGIMFALDEPTQICRLPLPKWSAYFGSHNMTMVIAAQSRAQLAERWGATGAKAIINNSDILLFGGLRDADELRDWEKLIGERAEFRKQYDRAGAVNGIHEHFVPIFTVSQLSQLPAGKVILIKRGLRPVLAKVNMAWDRPDVMADQAARNRETVQSTEWSKPAYNKPDDFVEPDGLPADDHIPDAAGASSPDLTVKAADASLRDGQRPPSLDSEPPPGS